MRSARPVLADRYFVTAHQPSGAVGPTPALRAAIRRAGLRVAAEHPDGYLVPPSVSLDALAAMGFRARALRDRRLLRLSSGTLDVTRLPPRPALAASWSHWLVQLAGPLTTSWIDRVRMSGASCLRPIPPYGLWAVIPPGRAVAVRALPFVVCCEPMPPALRRHPSLTGLTGAGIVRVRVTPASALADVRAGLGAPSVRVGEDVLEVTLDPSQLSRVLQLPDVFMVERGGRDLPLDERAAQIMAGRLDAAPPPDEQPVAGYRDVLASLALDGAGVLVGFVDSGLDTHDDDTLHPDLRGRGRFFDDLTDGAFATDTTGHGTRVAGAAVGNAATASADEQGFLYGLGVAPGAPFGSLNAINRGVVADDGDRVRRLAAHGVVIANNSWGEGDEGGAAAFDQGYSSRSEAYDRAVRDAFGDGTGIPLTIVAALGNGRPARDGEPGSVQAPWETKNAITVGATVSGRLGDAAFSGDVRSLSLKSSAGPTRDGRRAPTVVAPGMFVTTTHSQSASSVGLEVLPGRYVIARGTSIAAAHVSGLCALYVQWWRRHHDGADPSPAMLKALLVHGAVDCAGGEVGPPTTDRIRPAPDRHQGWGRASLAPLLDGEPKVFVDQGVALTTANQDFTLRVAAAVEGRPLRVTLAYTDAPGSPVAFHALVNRLSLEVSRADGSVTWRGNRFRDGWTVPGGPADDADNVACVYLPAATGSYVVRVVASTVIADARGGEREGPWQDFALVVGNAWEEGPVRTPSRSP